MRTCAYVWTIWGENFPQKVHYFAYDEVGCFQDMNVCNMNYVEIKLINHLKNVGSETIILKPKLRTYILFKHEFETEEYVLYNLSRSERSLLAQLRAGTLPLHIETGRYVNTPVEERFCLCCQSHSVEDELHFIFDCALYNSLRDQLFSFLNTQNPNFITYSRLETLKLLYKHFPRQVAKFVKFAYEKRTKFLFPPTRT